MRKKKKVSQNRGHKNQHKVKEKTKMRVLRKKKLRKHPSKAR